MRGKKMSFDKNIPREMQTIDSCGNVWKLSLTKMETKTNRYQLSFFFNDKEFGLSKLQSNRTADDIWQLLQSIKKDSATQSEAEEEKPVGRPKKRVLVVPMSKTPNKEHGKSK